jgi:hypothetical protein
MTIPKVGSPVGKSINENIMVKRLKDSFGRRSSDGQIQSDYEEIKHDDPAIQRLCANQIGSIDPRLASLHRTLCGVDEATATYEVTLAYDGNTACGRTDVIACTLPHQGIQLNVADFRFVSLGQAAGPFVGRGSTSIDLMREWMARRLDYL